MHPLLAELGVPPELQANFDIEDLSFDFGNDRETFSRDAHLVPTTEDLWLAGNYPASELIITHSAMEAIAYMTINAWRHPAKAALSFLAIGNYPHPRQLQWMRNYCQKRKITLVFPNDLTGRTTDIAVSAGIRGKAVRAVWHTNSVNILLNGAAYRFSPELISLNAFEKASGIRTAVRTRKPLKHNTFLEQLCYDKFI